MPGPVNLVRGIRERIARSAADSRRDAGSGPPGWLWLAALGMLTLAAVVVVPLTVVSLVPVPVPPRTPGQVANNCRVATQQPMPPGETSPQPIDGENPGGPPVRNAHWYAPTSIDTLNDIQLRNATAIATAAREFNATDQEIVLLFMAAMVETRLYNLASDAPTEADSLNYPNDGVAVDHRSVGMYQQQHWHGTPAERMDIRRATYLFLEGKESGDPPGLRDKPNWQSQDPGAAVQSVQRSAFPGRYAEFEQFAQQLLARVGPDAGIAAPNLEVGGVPIGCGPRAYDSDLNAAAPDWLTRMLPGVQPDTMLVAAAVANRWPQITVYGGVREDSLPYHPSGRGLDIMISSAIGDFKSPAGVQLGTDIAEFIKSNADALGVDHIIWNAQIWSVGRGGEGWRPCEQASCYAGADDTAAHRDHVHVTTFGNRGTTMPSQPVALPAGSGQAVAPLPPGTYKVNNSFGNRGANWSSTHTGEDFSAPTGTPVFSVLDGTVLPSLNQAWAGLNVVVQHPGGHITVYAHLSSITTPPGTQVRAGQEIGKVGSTGNSTGPHLHMEYHPPGVGPEDVYGATDPLAWLRANGVQI